MTLKNIKKMKDQKGFTIVELLIVIVIIGILAALVIVAYNGIQNRARSASGQSLANAVSKKIEAIGTIKNGVYYGSATGVTGAQINTYANAAPTATEGVIDTPASVVAATNVTTSGLDATSGNNGKTVAVFACGGGANIWYWDYAATSPAQAVVKAGAGCS